MNISFLQNDTFRKFTKNVSWLTIDQVIRMGVSAVISVLVARYYGKEQFSIFNTSLAFVSLFIPIMTLGYDGYLIRDLLNEPEKKNEILGSSLIVRIFNAAISTSIIFLIIQLSPFYRDSASFTLICVLSLNLFTQCFDVFDLQFKAHLLGKYTVLSKGVSFVIFSLLKLYCIINKFDILYFAILQAIELIFSAILGYNIYVKKLKNKISDWFFVLQRAIRLYKESFPLLVSNLSSNFYARIDQILLANMVGYGSSGEFIASTKIFEIFLAVTNVINISLFPVLNQLYNNNKQKFIDRLRLIIEGYSLLSYGIYILIFFFSDEIIELTFTSKFGNSADILKYQAIGLVFMFNGGLRSTYLAITGSQKILIFTTFASALANLALNLILIPHYGAIGAALVSSLTHFLSLQLLNIFFKSTRALFFYEIYGFLPITILNKLKKALR